MNQIFTGKVIGLKSANKKVKNSASDKPDTATVELVFDKLHPKYHKPIKRRRKIQAHNEEHDLQLGDQVVIKSSRPYSATKRFLVIKKEEKL